MPSVYHILVKKQQVPEHRIQTNPCDLNSANSYNWYNEKYLEIC